MSRIVLSCREPLGVLSLRARPFRVFTDGVICCPAYAPANQLIGDFAIELK